MYAIIVGCGRVGAQIANLLSIEGHNVVVIDRNSHSFNRLGANFNGITKVGSGYDLEVLEDAGIKKADALAAVTNEDNVNIIAAQVAKTIFKVPRVITRIYDPKREELYEEFGLDVIGGTTLLARLIRDKLIEKTITHSLSEDYGMDVIELKVNDDLSDLTMEKIEERERVKIFAIIRPGEAIHPQKDMHARTGDILISVGETKR
ncbi:MAG: TrkA family potassium uptake protein [Candidatus Desantisbacteria bacterium]